MSFVNKERRLFKEEDTICYLLKENEKVNINIKNISECDL